MHIAIQGALGSFHHQAAKQLEPKATSIPKQTFADVFKAVQNRETDYGLCAIENTLYGPIEEVYTLLNQEDIWIVRDVQLQIAQHLIGPNKVSLEELTGSNDVRVLSQAPAVAQAEHWLALHLPKATIEITQDTAASVQAVVALGQPHTLAIAGRLAATTYGGVIVAEGIQDNPRNYTRFLLFCRKRQPVQRASLGSMILKTNGQPDMLVNALQVFTDANCSLSRLRSYPASQASPKHIFFIDYQLPNGGSHPIIQALQKQGCTVKLLGEYSSAPLIRAL
ncbi:MAG TPA: prephenate dehydratase domain-containing protein [Candidatus Saccharimonadia bacterium]|nr:prephenate dehydratase domain-containing protein [Candidatus Saccharimonadia bacterium]